jgi:hypothetical protein
MLKFYYSLAPNPMKVALFLVRQTRLFEEQRHLHRVGRERVVELQHGAALPAVGLRRL